MTVPATSNGEQSQASFNEQLRSALNDAYAALEGQRSLESFSAFTFEDAADLLIERISGDDTPNRPNLLHKTERINNTLQASVAKILSLKPSAFAEASKTTDVNTPPENYDPDQEESTTVQELPA